MIECLTFLLPCVIGLKIILKFNPKRELKKLIIDYFLLALFSNLICIAIIIFKNHFDDNFILYCQEHLIFSLKYILLLLLVNTILSIGYVILINCVDISLEVKQNDKKNT